MSADWHVGMQVVCVDDDWGDEPIVDTMPVKGRVYTIRGAENGHPGAPHPVYFFLKEIVNRPRLATEGFGEACFGCGRFRPVRRTDISVFTAMLKPVHDKSPVMA